ncbi:MAG: L7Ae/L30e/S12e/Gadd45 family ribosomal protein [bacterium]
MPLTELKEAKKKTIGTKQTLKAIEKGIAKKVYIAKDAEAHITAPLRQKCQERDIVVIDVETMKELGAICGIQVGAASAAVVKG